MPWEFFTYAAGSFPHPKGRNFFACKLNLGNDYGCMKASFVNLDRKAFLPLVLASVVVSGAKADAATGIDAQKEELSARICKAQRSQQVVPDQASSKDGLVTMQFPNFPNFFSNFPNFPNYFRNF